MIPALLLAIASPIPNGTYGIRDLCEKMSSEAAHYSVDARLADYPVFVATKSGDPDRVRKLVADAVHGEWKNRVLTPVAYDTKAELEQFRKDWLEATKEQPVLGGLDILSLFRQPAGSIQRFGNPSIASAKPWPPALRTQFGNDPNAYVLIRSFGRGMYETASNLGEDQIRLFDPRSEVTINRLPEEVAAFIGPNIDARPISEAHQAQLGGAETLSRIMRSTLAAGSDPIAALLGPAMLDISAKVDRDMVVVLPDMILFVALDWSKGNATVGTSLASCARAVAFKIEDDAIIGALPYTEVLAPAQTRRAVVRDYLHSIGEDGAPSSQALSDYMAHQRPGASETWLDAMMLAMAGVVLDTSYLGDYPFNSRLYAALDNNDWRLIRDGQPFLAERFGTRARAALAPLLLQSRDCMSRDHVDPARWSTLQLSSLTVTPTLQEETVLSYMRDGIANVDSVEGAARDHDRQSKKTGKEPLYRVGSRRKLEFVISTGKPEEEKTTGFAEVDLPSKAAVEWSKLPAGLKAQFEKELLEFRATVDSVPPTSQP